MLGYVLCMLLAHIITADWYLHRTCHVKASNPESVFVTPYMLINLDGGLLMQPKCSIDFVTHEYVYIYKILYMCIWNMHILHGPGSGRVLGPGPLRA